MSARRIRRAIVNDEEDPGGRMAVTVTASGSKEVGRLWKEKVKVFVCLFVLDIEEEEEESI